jgi:hypothetical protein
MNRAGWIRVRQWLSAFAILAGCGQTTSRGQGFGDTGGDGGTTDGGFGQPGTSSGGILPTGPVNDFPTPVIDTGAPMNAASLFSAAQGASSGGPCLVEPEANVLYPQNWLNPRFRWTPTGSENLFELRLHVANQMNDLVVYTPNSVWTMPTTMWDALRMDSATEAMTITLTGATLSGSALQNVATGTQTPMGVAPVQATGAIVYWALNESTQDSVLKGFSPGDNTVEPVLSPMQYSQQQQLSAQYQQQGGYQETSVCIGCHASTPDGAFAGFSSIAVPGNEEWNGGIALIQEDAGAVGAAPTFMGAAGAVALQNYNTGGMTFSEAHWATGDRRAIVMFDHEPSSAVTEAPSSDLTWVDIEATTMATASGTIARMGDTQLAAAPSWSHDGNTIAYVSTNRVCTGRLGNCDPNGGYLQVQDQGSVADIYTVPYAGGAGGTATPLNGASEATLQEYYPAYSPDDSLVAFNRIPNNLNLYYQPAAELFVIPASGGTATRLAANDPPQCTNHVSPGLNNIWPKWGPAAPSASGLTYYWMIFSSERYDGMTEQLYMTAVVKNSSGSLQTYGAIYLWNQPSTENNKTPAWDKFKVPPLPPLQ